MTHTKIVLIVVSREEKTHIKIPWNIEDAKQLGIVLDRYKDDNYYQVMGGVFITYVLYPFFFKGGSTFLRTYLIV